MLIFCSAFCFIDAERCVYNMLCRLCATNFTSSTWFLRHFKKDHTIDGVTKYKCPYNCDRVYSNLSSFKTHIKSHYDHSTHIPTRNKYVSVVTDNLLGECFGNFELHDDDEEVDDYSDEPNEVHIYEK